MKKIIILIIATLLIIGYLIGCSEKTPEVMGFQTSTLQPLIPYLTSTTTRPAPTLTPLKQVPLSPTPSATPFFHVVVQGETMLGIALRYGITLEALQAANPEIDPYVLSIDTQLIIPFGNEIQVNIPQITPVNLILSDPTCYRTGEGGVWCYLLVVNNLNNSVENLSAWIGLYDDGGNIVESAVAIGLVNILKPGAAIPLTTFFDPYVPANVFPRAELLTAVEIPSGDTRYLDWELGDVRIDIRGDQRQEAIVTGTINQPEVSAKPSQVWIVAVAYNTEGQVVGVRRIETTGELTFTMVVYSLREAIERVEILTEIRP